jgi:hypothetical protein
MTVPRQRALEFLRSRSAHTMTHLNGTLLEHLMATEELLASWGSSEELCRAGLCHAVYGTDGFAPCLVPWEDRTVLARVVGGDVEESVYLYASCDRSFLYPQLSRTGPVCFRDRFRDETFEPSDAALRDFVDLTLANELDVALARGHVAPPVPPPWIGPLVEQMEGRASPGARRGVSRLLSTAPS